MPVKEKIIGITVTVGQVIGWCGFFLSMMIDDTKSGTAAVVRLLILSTLSITVSAALMWFELRKKEKSAPEEREFWIDDEKENIQPNYAKEFESLYEKYGKNGDLHSTAKK